MTFNATPRRKFTTLQRARFFEARHGICWLCNQRIDGTRERWEIEHVIARELMGDGADDDANLGLVHAECHKAKTASDKATIAKSNRQHAKNIGAHRASRPLRSAGFPKAKPQHTATSPLRKGVGQFEDMT